MAEPAEVVRIVIKTEMDAASQRTAEAQFDQTMNKMTASAGKAEAVVTSTAGKMSGSLNSIDPAARRAGAGVQQMSQMLTAGKAPLASMTEQAVTMAGALAGGGGGVAAAGARVSILGAATRVMSFFGGPWGIGLAAAGFALSAFINRQKDEATQLEIIYDKLVKQKAQSDLNRQADEMWANSLGGLIEQQRKLNTELDKRLSSQAKLQDQGIAEQARKADMLGQYAERVAADPTKSAEVKRTARELASQANVNLFNMQAEAARNLGKAYGDAGTAAALWGQRQADTMIRIVQSHPELKGSMASMEGATNQLQQAMQTAASAGVSFGDTGRQVRGLNDQLLHGKVTAADYTRQVKALAAALEAEAAAAKKAKSASARKPGAPDYDLQSFINPVGGGRVTGEFGEKRAGRRPGYSHGGIDLAVPQGTPVRAAAGGIIVESGTVPGYGNVIAIDHGQGTLTRYAHLSKLGATKGTVVEQGQVIGASGGARGTPGAGNSTGAHLHYEVRQNGRAVDPRKGEYRANAFDVNNKAMVAQAKAEAEAARLAEERLQQQARLESELAQLDERLVRAQQERATTIEQSLANELESIEANRVRLNSEYKIAEAKGRIAEGASEQLIGANNQAAQAERERALQEGKLQILDRDQKLALERQEQGLSALAYELEIAKTADERKTASAALLAAEQALERAKLEQIANNELISDYERQRARIALENLDAEQARARDRNRRDPANKSPIEQYQEDLEKTTGQIDEDLQRITVDGLEAFNDGLVDAIMGAKSLGEVFDDVANQIIAALIRIAIQQLIIKPLADILGGGMSGGGGGGSPYLGVAGTILGALLPGRAGGGQVTGGKAYWVGENGPEPFFPSQNGQIIPNNEAAKLLGQGGGNNAPSVSLVVNAPGATAETVSMIRRELAAAAPMIVSAAQRSTISQLTRPRT